MLWHAPLMSRLHNPFPDPFHLAEDHRSPDRVPPAVQLPHQPIDRGLGEVPFQRPPGDLTCGGLTGPARKDQDLPCAAAHPPGLSLPGTDPPVLAPDPLQLGPQDLFPQVIEEMREDFLYCYHLQYT